MKMNLIFFSRCVTTLLLYLGIGFLPSAAFAQTKSLVILTLEESEDTDQIRTGIREVLRTAGAGANTRQARYHFGLVAA
jgi:hypothetical protein